MPPMRSHSKCIVVFKPDTPQDEIDRHAEEIKAKGGTITNIYNTVLKGFAAIIPDSHLAILHSLTSSSGPIDYIENDGTVTIQE